MGWQNSVNSSLSSAWCNRSAGFAQPASSASICSRNFLSSTRYSSRMSAPLLRVDRLTKRFGGLVAVDRISLEVRRDEIVGLIGPNGAGKTTLLRLTTKILKPDAGSIGFRGADITALRPWEVVERGIAGTFQNTRPFRHLPIIASGTMTLAMMGRWRKGRVFWNVPAMPRSTTSHGRRAVMSAPRNTMLPASGLRIFVISRSSVVLPAPFGPISPTISSRRSSKLIRSTATRPPKRLVSRSTRRSGADMRLEYLVDDKKLLEQMGAELAGWANPAERLHQALDKDEFTLFCQPIVALTGAERYPRAEILVRLREEDRAVLPPGEFLPVFEHYRLMPQLDRWVVRTTVKRLARGSRIPRFTVNLSGQTLEDADFPRFVAGQLASNHVLAGALLFEIDESDTLARLDAAVRFANAYRALGGKLMIDGFGRRSVSFNAIEALGAEYVKVDGAITRKLLTSEVAKAKMNALLRVAEALGFAMVAEFVEDQAVLLRLKALGVGYAQGFGIYQPHPVDSFAAEAVR